MTNRSDLQWTASGQIRVDEEQPQLVGAPPRMNTHLLIYASRTGVDVPVRLTRELADASAIVGA